MAGAEVHGKTSSPVLVSKTNRPSHDEVRTIFITGLPNHVNEGELQDLLISLPGYEASQLKFKGEKPRGFALFSTSQLAIAAKDSLQEMTFDADSKSALHIKLAKKNHLIKRGHGEDADGILVDNDQNEPTMGEKLASLKLLDGDKTRIQEKEDSSPRAKPPSADSVNVLLKQALHADDHALLLECLYNQDQKVIANSISLLNPSDVLKLLHSLVSIIQSRGAVLACALPWIKSLVLQHASGIMSQESSLLALNSVYQLIESRVSTFQSAIEISSCLDFLYSGIIGDWEEDTGTVPVIYEDKDESDEEESEDAMEADEDTEEEEAIDGVSDFEGIDYMSD